MPGQTQRTNVANVREPNTHMLYRRYIAILMVPAMRGARASLLTALTQNGKGTIGPSHQRWRHGLLVAQTGLATTLVVVAALLLQSLVRLQHVPLGFEPGGVLTARVSTPRVKYPDPAATLGFQRTLVGSLEALPSVRSVGSMTSAPFAPGVRRTVTVHDRALIGRSADARSSALQQIVSPGLFRSLGVRLLAGRDFGAQDQPGSPLVAIVSESLARSLWPNGDVVGRALDFDGRSHGSLYPALQRLERDGLITSKWADDRRGREMKFYRLTPDGRKQLTVEESRWKKIARAMARMLQPGSVTR